MKIKVNIYDPDSIKDAIDQVNSYSKWLETKIEEIISRLADLGEQIVDSHYSQSGEAFITYCEKNRDSAMIIAVGDNVVFLEFGTGFDVQDKREDLGMETEGLPEIYGGSWSETEGRGTFARHGHWHYRNVDYTGTEARLGFYFASKAIRDKAVEIAKEVFNR